MNRHHFLTTCTWDALNVNANRTEVLLMNTEKSSNRESPLEQLKSYLVGTSHTRTRSGHAKNCVEHIANRHIEQLSNYVRSPHHVLDDHQFKKEENPNRDDHRLTNVDQVTSNAKPSHFGALPCIFEDNEAAIKIDDGGQKSDNETCVPYPQSRAR